MNQVKNQIAELSPQEPLCVTRIALLPICLYAFISTAKTVNSVKDLGAVRLFQMTEKWGSEHVSHKTETTPRGTRKSDTRVQSYTPPACLCRS